MFAIFLVAGCGGKTSTTTNDDNNSGNNNSTHGTNLSETSTKSSNPKITSDSSGNVYVTWEEASSGSITELYLADSANSGNTFSKRNLNKTANCNINGHAGDISVATAGNGSPYTVWTEDWGSIGKNIKFYDNKSSSSCKPLSYLARDAASPMIKADSNSQLHVVWEEDMGDQKRDIFFRHSDNGGTDFIPSTDAEPLNISNTASDSSDPMLGVLEGTLNSDIDIVWVEGTEGNRNISIASSNDSGTSFSTPHNVSNTLTDSNCPVINVTSGGTIYIAFKGDSGIYFTRRQSYESLIPAPIKISPGSSSPSCPEMGVGSNGAIYTVWSDSGEIWAAISTDAGHSFTVPKNISTSTGQSSSPKLALDGNYLNLIWVEEAIGNGDIYFSGSIDNGKTFSSPRNISNSSEKSGSPAIATDAKKYIYAAWAEGEEGSEDIYFVRDNGARDISKSAKKTLAQFMDINGDGKSDILIGAPSDKDGSVIGKVYLFFSNSMALKLNGSDILTTSADLTFSEASAGEQFGFSTAIAGDINGDGYADIITGAPYTNDNADNSGTVYIYYGNQSSSMDNTADVRIKGLEVNDLAGFSVSSAGDVNNDGFDDIIIGLPEKYSNGSTPYSGTAVIFYGGPIMGIKANYPELTLNDADVVLKGEKALDKFGTTVARAGDFNYDGYDDVIVGAPYADGTDGYNRGRAYIFFGGTDMNVSADVRITGSNDNDKIAAGLSGGGDVDGDGYSDVIIGAPEADTDTGVNRGKVYIFYGLDMSDGELKDITIGADSSGVKMTVLTGNTDHEFLGTSVGNAGDTNGDTYDDIAAGGKYMGTDTTFRGKAYVYYGWPSMDAVDTSPDVTFSAEHQEDRFGNAVAGAGDVNGDGYYDVVVGAYLSDGSGTSFNDRGRTYLYTGGTPNPDSTADITFTGTIDNGWSGYSLYKIQ